MNTKTQLENIYSKLARKNNELNVQLDKTKEELGLVHKALLLDFLQVIDTFEQAEAAIEEKRWNENELANKSIKRLLTAKKKMLSIFEKHGVVSMNFEKNIANDNDCKTIDTEHDEEYPNNYILSLEKKGYTISKEKNGQMIKENLRLAEVIIVKK